MLLTSCILLSSVALSAGQGYAPVKGACPSGATSLLRLGGLASSGNQTLNVDEIAYIAARKEVIAAGALPTFLGGANSSLVYAGNLTDVPTVAIAISGGGDRAALYGAAALAQFDGRNASSKLGGVLQIASYVSALSGGSWMLSSFVTNPNGMPDPYTMVQGSANDTSGGWNLQLDLFSPAPVTNTSLQTSFENAIFADLSKKSAAGQPVTFGDYWARALSYHFLPGTTTANFFDTTLEHGNSIDYSSVVATPDYVKKLMPFPLIVGLAYSVNTKIAPQYSDVPVQNIVYEMGPLEFGSYDQSLSAFVPMKYLGTPLNAGTPINSTCVTNFDNAGWILGVSSNLFNLYNVTSQAAWNNPISPIYKAWTRINSTFASVQPNQQLDISAVANPFLGVGSASGFQDTNEAQLRLIDGGLNGEVDAVEPFVVPARGVDCMFVVDGAGDNADYTPNGASMRATQFRASLPGYNLSFPPVPVSNVTWIEQKLDQRPTFFGCNATAAKLSGKKVSSPYPLVVYLPNYSPGFTNTTTGQIQYPQAQVVSFLNAAYHSLSIGLPPANQTSDADWLTCVRCATVERTRGKNGIDQTAACGACFSRYCWNGVESTASSSSSGTGTGSGSSNGSVGAGNGTTTAKSSASKLGASLLAFGLGGALLL